jgi:TPR repeat protein
MKIKWIALMAIGGLLSGCAFDHSAQVLRRAKSGNPQAQYELGKCYASGDGVSQDLFQAAIWYARSAEQNHTEAQYEMARCYDEGAGVLKDDEAAQQYYTPAAEKGHALAQYYLARTYVICEYTRQSYRKAADLYFQAAIQNLGLAQYQLALAYDAGRGVKRDTAEAVAWGILAEQNGAPGVQQKIAPRLSPETIERGTARAKELADKIQRGDF